MDGLTLIDKAVAAGLTVEAIGDRLRIRGPRSADQLAQRLIEHKSEILAALAENRPSRIASKRRYAVGRPEIPRKSVQAIAGAGDDADVIVLPLDGVDRAVLDALAEKST